MRGRVDGRWEGGVQGERFVVRPRRWVLAVYVFGIVAFAAVGLLVVVLGDTGGRLWGVAALLFFGVGGALSLPRLMRPGMTLTPQGIELTAGGLIPWEDIADVGIVRLPRGAKALGISLARTDRYLASWLGERAGWRRTLARLAQTPYGGYHVVLSPVQLDRPLKQFPAFLWEYAQAVRRAPGAPRADGGPSTGRSGW